MSDRRRLRAKHRPDRLDFANFVAALPRPVGLLGLTHVTSGYVLRDIVESKSISAVEECPVLNEPLIYAFYGRSAFRKKDDDRPSDLSFMFPVVFILDPSKVPAPKYVFGFDSGAFVNGFMDDYLDPNMPLFDFHVSPNVYSAASMVQYFFGGSERFLDNQPSEEISVPDSNFEAASYKKLVQSGGRGANRLDDRVSTPEIIFADPVPLAGAVKVVILPHVFAQDPLIGGKITALGVRISEYEWRPVTRPPEYHILIRNMVEGLYNEFGWSH